MSEHHQLIDEGKFGSFRPTSEKDGNLLLLIRDFILAFKIQIAYLNVRSKEIRNFGQRHKVADMS